MLKRLLYGICLAFTLLGIYIKGSIYVSALRLGRGTAVPAIFDLLYIVGFFVAALVCGRELVGRPLRASRVTTTGPIGNQEPSLRSQLQSLSGKGPEAFSRRPVAVSLTVLLLAAIPFGLVILRAGSWNNLSQFDWLMIVLTELPLAFVAAIAVFGPKMPDKP
jgi:hypothetical protein